MFKSSNYNIDMKISALIFVLFVTTNVFLWYESLFAYTQHTDLVVLKKQKKELWGDILTLSRKGDYYLTLDNPSDIPLNNGSNIIEVAESLYELVIVGDKLSYRVGNTTGIELVFDIAREKEKFHWRVIDYFSLLFFLINAPFFFIRKWRNSGNMTVTIWIQILWMFYLFRAI